jgi:hypothetical protein
MLGRILAAPIRLVNIPLKALHALAVVDTAQLDKRNVVDRLADMVEREVDKAEGEE